MNISTDAIHFENISLEDVKMYLTITNTSKIGVQIEMARKKSKEDEIWYTVEPDSLCLGANSDETIEITGKLNPKLIEKIINGRLLLNDILYVQVIKGKIYEVKISGEYKNTAFCASINYLCKINTSGKI